MQSSLAWKCNTLPHPLTFGSTSVSDTNSPPQFSRLKRLLKLWLTKGEIFFRSWVRTLVARSDWWASLNVVSISSRPWWARTALAKPSGPSRRSTSRKPTGGSPGGGVKVRKFRGNLASSHAKKGFHCLQCLTFTGALQKEWADEKTVWGSELNMLFLRVLLG